MQVVQFEDSKRSGRGGMAVHGREGEVGGKRRNLYNALLREAKADRELAIISEGHRSAQKQNVNDWGWQKSIFKIVTKSDIKLRKNDKHWQRVFKMTKSDKSDSLVALTEVLFSWKGWSISWTRHYPQGIFDLEHKRASESQNEQPGGKKVISIRTPMLIQGRPLHGNQPNAFLMG